MGMGQTRSHTAPELPTLDPGVNLLRTDAPRGPLQSLVLDHLLLGTGRALWIDSHGQAATTSLARLAPSRRLLDRISVARGFTAYQHYSLLETLSARLVADETDASLVVVPFLDYHYRADDLPGTRGAEMLQHAANRLEAIRETVELPILLTLEAADAVSRPVVELADETITCERTQFGPRFVGEAFETLVYQEEQYLQTTLAFWSEVLTERASTADGTEVSGVGAY
jgi:hypothetical protein